MFAFWVIEHFFVDEDILSGLLSGYKCAPHYALTLEQVEEALYGRIAVTIPTPAHWLFKVVYAQKGSPIPTSLLQPCSGWIKTGCITVAASQPSAALVKQDQLAGVTAWPKDRAFMC